MSSVNSIKSNNGPQYSSFWQYNIGELKTIGKKIVEIALSALIGLGHFYLFHKALIFVPVILLTSVEIYNIRKIYCRNLGKNEYEYSKTLPKNQSEVWLKKAAEHEYLPAMTEYAILKSDMNMLKEAAYLGEIKALAVCSNLADLGGKIKSMDLQLKWKLSLNTETFPRKPQDFIEIVKKYSFSANEFLFLSTYINSMIDKFGFSHEETDQIRQAIGLSSG